MRSMTFDPRAQARRLFQVTIAAILISGTGRLGAAPVAGEAGSLEYRVKSVYLYNFIKFVEWPSSAFISEDAPFVVGILDDHAEGIPEVLETFRGKVTPVGRPIEVRVLRAPDYATEGVHLLFVSRIAHADWRTIVRGAAGQPLLLVGEVPGFAQQGGMMNLLVSGDGVRFEVNLRRAQTAKLKLSGRLANVAQLVRDAEPTL